MADYNIFDYLKLHQVNRFSELLNKTQGFKNDLASTVMLANALTDDVEYENPEAVQDIAYDLYSGVRDMHTDFIDISDLHETLEFALKLVEEELKARLNNKEREEFEQVKLMRALKGLDNE